MASHDVVTPRVGERSLGSTLSEVSDEKGYLASDAHRVEDGHLPGSKESLDKDPLIHDEVKEVVPDQAFKWNVDGDQSPFPEVAANVPNTDDPTIQVNSAYSPGPPLMSRRSHVVLAYLLCDHLCGRQHILQSQICMSPP